MKKIIYSFLIPILISSYNYCQPVVDGQFVVIINNGTNYIVKVQISTNTGTDALGDATIPFTFNTNDLIYVSTTFQNFSGGDYYTATATNSPSDRISLNITFDTGSGTLVSNSFMDVATITFTTKHSSGSSNLAFASPLEFFSTSLVEQWTNGTFTDENTTPLPVELSSFTASVNQNSVSLKWQTATELNNYGFDVERKSQTESWIKIGFVPGAGNSSSTKDYVFNDNNISGSGKLQYRLKQIDNDGSFKYSKVAEVNISSPEDYALEQNYPNPFNPGTLIKFSLPEPGLVKLKVYNLLGQDVVTLVNKYMNEGTHKVDLDMTGYPSGVYIYKLDANGFTDTKKMIYLR